MPGRSESALLLRPEAVFPQMSETARSKCPCQGPVTTQLARWVSLGSLPDGLPPWAPSLPPCTKAARSAMYVGWLAARHFRLPVFPGVSHPPGALEHKQHHRVRAELRIQGICSP
jgi:hypothetical protein